MNVGKEASRGGGTGVGVGQDETGHRRGRSMERKPLEFLYVPTCVDEAGRSWFDQSVESGDPLNVDCDNSSYSTRQGIEHGGAWAWGR